MVSYKITLYIIGLHNMSGETYFYALSKHYTNLWGLHACDLICIYTATVVVMVKSADIPSSLSYLYLTIKNIN